MFTRSICRTGQLTGHISEGIIACGVAGAGGCCLRWRGRGGEGSAGAAREGVEGVVFHCPSVLAAYISQVETAEQPTLTNTCSANVIPTWPHRDRHRH